jgi:GMP synthase-like glutamine amidotransferase
LAAPPGVFRRCELRIQVLQHVPFEGPARIADYATAHGHALAVARVDLGIALPSPEAFELLVVMGGPMSVHDEREHPWLEAEKRCVAAAIEADRGVLGICLGAQLIALTSGARVYPASEKEIGWFPVRGPRSAVATTAHVLLPERFTPLHWHGETFDLPPLARRLAETDVCENQAFQLHDRVVGLQFHLEATTASVRALVEHAAGDIMGGDFQQLPAAILAEAPARTDATAPLIEAVLDHLIHAVERG